MISSFLLHSVRYRTTSDVSSSTKASSSAILRRLVLVHEEEEHMALSASAGVVAGLLLGPLELASLQ